MKIIERKSIIYYIRNYVELISKKDNCILLNDHLFDKRVVIDFYDRSPRMIHIGNNGKCFVASNGANNWLFDACHMNDRDRYKFLHRILKYETHGSFPECKSIEDTLKVLTELLIIYNKICMESTGQ